MIYQEEANLIWKKALKKIKTYAKDIVIYPGHGDKTTIGYELENNEFLR